jgi:hypothetical protein
LIPDGWQVKQSQPDLADLTEWAVEVYYPGDWPDAVGADHQPSAHREVPDERYNRRGRADEADP